MQNNIHPKYTKFVIHVGQDKFHTMSCCKHAEYTMDRDFRKHPAWTKQGVSKAEAVSSSISTYKKKYGDLGFL